MRVRERACGSQDHVGREPSTAGTARSGIVDTMILNGWWRNHVIFEHACLRKHCLYVSMHVYVCSLSECIFV